MKACPTSGLQPTLGEAGLEGIWTPVLKSRLGYCDYACHACGRVCPSGAIPPLSLERKREQVLGVAVIDKDRCLPWATDTPCIVCQEMCPVPEKAVVLGPEREVTRADGGTAPGRAAGGGREPLHRLRHLRVQVPPRGTSAIVVVPASTKATAGAVPPGVSAPAILAAMADDRTADRPARRRALRAPRRRPARAARRPSPSSAASARKRHCSCRGTRRRLLPARRGAPQGVQAAPRRPHGHRAARGARPDLRGGGALPRDVSVEHRDDDRVPALPLRQGADPGAPAGRAAARRQPAGGHGAPPRAAQPPRRRAAAAGAGAPRQVPAGARRRAARAGGDRRRGRRTSRASSSSR